MLNNLNMKEHEGNLKIISLTAYAIIYKEYINLTPVTLLSFEACPRDKQKSTNQLLLYLYKLCLNTFLVSKLLKYPTHLEKVS